MGKQHYFSQIYKITQHIVRNPEYIPKTITKTGIILLNKGDTKYTDNYRPIKTPYN